MCMNDDLDFIMSKRWVAGAREGMYERDERGSEVKIMDGWFSPCGIRGLESDVFTPDEAEKQKFNKEGKAGQKQLEVKG